MYGPNIWPMLNAEVIIATEMLIFPINLFFPSTRINATDPGTPKPYNKQEIKKKFNLLPKNKNDTPNVTVKQEKNNK